MRLRCKPGDLAIVVSGENTGKIVVCDEYIGSYHIETGALINDLWHVSYQGRKYGKIGRYVESDSCLFPIRPGDLKETDETNRELTV